ncbi:MAG: DUF255 domain-containing protein [Pseudomonadota bacterium]|nr:DUF255 domain-containing protein [Pseudomonadota bacterium]
MDAEPAEPTGAPVATEVGPAGCDARTLPGAPPQPAELKARFDEALKARGSGYVPRTEHRLPDGSPCYTNRLVLEASPYLIQHAHNPVDWYAWGTGAFEKARRENKPVFLSIGYSTCHWCHVMERESFEDPEIARFLNEHFVAIKVDRERRPDVDELYMTAVMLTTGHGGWPMSSFLTADGKPFFGGTYFPPDRFLKLLTAIDALWTQDREALSGKADRIAQAVERALSTRAAAARIDDDITREAIDALARSHDEVQGGFSVAPKFPNEVYLLFLMDQVARGEDSGLSEIVRLTLDHMARGGIHDQVGGGFHRYSIDPDWLVPHFEKMLYNQALLARVYTQAYRLYGDPQYARVARRALDYVLRDMTSPEGGFFSATDADSEGEEGRFFLWTPGEIRSVLGAEDAALALAFFGVTDTGNFEGRNILNQPVPPREFARRLGVTEAILQARVDAILDRLYGARERREHPGRDEKLITAWNAMMIVALAEASLVLDDPKYLSAAQRAAGLLREHNLRADGGLWRVRLQGKSSIAGKLDDYAFLIEAFVALYDAGAGETWLAYAGEMARSMSLRFRDVSNGGFWLNASDGPQDLFTRPKATGDGAKPSGYSAAVRALARLHARTGEPEFGDWADAALAAVAGEAREHPGSHTYLLIAAGEMRNGESGNPRYAARGAVRVSSRLLVSSKAPGNGILDVELRLRPGWHVNSHRPLQKDLVPTELRITDVPDVRSGGKVSYPPPEIKRLSFLREPLSLYEGTVNLRTGVAIDRKTSGELDAVPAVAASLRLQACSDQVCLAPEEILLRLPAAGWVNRQ